MMASSLGNLSRFDLWINKDREYEWTRGVIYC